MEAFELPRPNLEKRILPLLDVALTLVGILMLMVAVSNEEPTSGVAGNVVNILINIDGSIQFDDSVIADKNQIYEPEMEVLNQVLTELEEPLVLVHYVRPQAGRSQQVNDRIVSHLIERIDRLGVLVRLSGSEAD